MADVKFSQFSEAASLTGSEEFVGLQSGNNIKVNLASKILTYINANAVIAQNQVTGLVAALSSKLNLSGGTMTGNLILNADPTSNLQAVTKQYVDNVVVIGEYLKISENLSDVNNVITSASNLGLSQGYVIYNDNTNHIISNPLPEVIGLGNTATQTFKLPAKVDLNSNTFGRLYFINNYESADQNFQDSDGNPIFTIKAHTNYIFSIPDAISSNYYVFPIVSFVNSMTGDVIIDLNSAYLQTASQNFNITSGLNINGNNLNLVGNDGSKINIDGSIATFSNPNDQGDLGTSSQLFFAGATPSVGYLQQMQLDIGFIYEVLGQESGFFNVEILDNGSVNSVFGVYGKNATYSGTRIVIGGTDSAHAHVDNVSIGVGIFGSVDFSALFQIDSTTQGVLLPRMTAADFQAISSPGTGLLSYASDHNGLQYWDGTYYQDVVTIDRLLSGTNTTIVNNGDGTATVNSSGGTGVIATFGSYSVLSNTFTTTIASSGIFYPISASGGFLGGNSSGFTPQLLTIAGVSTPILTSSAPTQFYEVDINLAVRGAVTSQANFVFCIAVRSASGTLSQTQFQSRIVLQDLVFPYDVSLSGIVQLANGDGIFIEVQNTSNTNSVLVSYINAKIANFSGSIASTDGLIQGSSNLYLSQDGGTTYDNVSGSAVVGNIPAFNSAGGQLIDSGISLSMGDWTPVFSSLVGISGSISLISSRYMKVGNILIITQDISFTASASSVSFSTSLPSFVVNNFTNIDQGALMGQSVSIASPTTADGDVIDAYAVTADVLLSTTINITVSSGTKYVRYSAMIEVQ